MVSPCSLLRNPALLDGLAEWHKCIVRYWHPGKGPPELCWALKMLLQPGREWGELVEELALFFPFSNPCLHSLTPAWSGFFGIPSVARWPGAPSVGKATCPVPSHTGLSHCPGWEQPSRAPQPGMGLGKGHFVPCRSPGAGPALPWEEGSPPAMAGEGLVPACTRHSRLVEREGSLIDLFA